MLTTLNFQFTEIHKKGIAGMQSSFIYNKAGHVSQSELKMSVHEHGHYLRYAQHGQILTKFYVKYEAKGESAGVD